MHICCGATNAHTTLNRTRLLWPSSQSLSLAVVNDYILLTRAKMAVYVCMYRIVRSWIPKRNNKDFEYTVGENKTYKNVYDCC